jgi:hypothetical protein
MSDTETSFQNHQEPKGSKESFRWTGKELPLEALLASHRKNMDAVRQAQQAVSELVRDVAQLNGQYARHSFDDVCRQTRSFFTQAGTPKNVDLEPFIGAIKSSFERSMAHYKQITELFSQSTSKVFNSYKKRFDEGLQEAQDLSQKQKV